MIVSLLTDFFESRSGGAMAWWRPRVALLVRRVRLGGAQMFYRLRKLFARLPFGGFLWFWWWWERWWYLSFLRVSLLARKDASAG